MAACVLKRFFVKAKRTLDTRMRHSGGVFKARLAETVKCTAGVCVLEGAGAGRTRGADKAVLLQILSGRARDTREGDKILVLRACSQGQSAQHNHGRKQRQVTRHAQDAP